MGLTSTENATLSVVAQNLGVSRDNLNRLISFESRWNPKAKNPYSSARGLLQWTDSTARSLGFSDSLDLVNKNPSILDQMSIVEKYLSQFKPFSGRQSLYMAVFYPAARNWSPNRIFPESVRKVNPGVNTPGDYINLVEGKRAGVAGSISMAAVALLSFALYHVFKGKASKK